jgi:hypothetical protein
MEKPMRYLLNELYRECSKVPNPSPNQAHALAEAASVLGSEGVPSMMLRNAFHEVRAAFENSPATAD